MRILSLCLTNFGIYRGINRFDFSTTKPVVLIGGMNGRGKTTLLEAVLVALYSANSSSYIKSGYTTFGQYLKAHTNTDPSSSWAAIKLSFLHESDGGEEVLTVERRWGTSSQRVHVNTKVRRNNTYDAFLTDNWAAYVENILPRALSNFFFFDGEKIAEMALDGSDNQIRNSIRTLLGVSTVDVLRRDLRTVSRRLSKAKQREVSSDVVDRLSEEIDTLKNRLAEIDAKIASLIESESEITKSIEGFQSDFVAAGGEAAAQRATYTERLRQLKDQLAQIHADKVSLCSGNAPLIMFSPMLPNLLNEIKAEYRRDIMAEALHHLDDLLMQYEDDNESIERFLAFARNEVFHGADRTAFQVTGTDVEELTRLLRELPALQNEYRELVERKALVSASICEVDDYLSIAIDDIAINEAKKALESSTQALGVIKSRLAALRNERTKVNGDYIRKNAEYKRNMSAFLSSLNASEENDRAIRFANLADEIFECFSIRLQERKVRDLSETIGECYRTLANKRGLITSIKMNPKTLEMIYIGPDGSEVDRQLLSAGEKQLMVIAILWALAKCSDKKFPVIIDTPLARLDSAHRLSIVRSYFPHASEQSIILSTDSEVFGDYYDALKPNISDEYTLIYDDNTRSTSIRRGYFMEAAR